MALTSCILHVRLLREVEFLSEGVQEAHVHRVSEGDWCARFLPGPHIVHEGEVRHSHHSQHVSLEIPELVWNGCEFLRDSVKLVQKYSNPLSTANVYITEIFIS